MMITLMDRNWVNKRTLNLETFHWNDVVNTHNVETMLSILIKCSLKVYVTMISLSSILRRKFLLLDRITGAVVNKPFKSQFASRLQGSKFFESLIIHTKFAKKLIANIFNFVEDAPPCPITLKRKTLLSDRTKNRFHWNHRFLKFAFFPFPLFPYLILKLSSKLMFCSIWSLSWGNCRYVPFVRLIWLKA